MSSVTNRFTIIMCVYVYPKIILHQNNLNRLSLTPLIIVVVCRSHIKNKSKYNDTNYFMQQVQLKHYS